MGAPDAALIYQHIFGCVSKMGKGGIGDGVKVGVFAEPKVFFAKQAMVDAYGA